MRRYTTRLFLFLAWAVAALAAPADKTLNLPIYSTADGSYKGTPLTVAGHTNHFLKFDGTNWVLAAGAGGGSSDWGSIGGNLPDQADLDTALALKAPRGLIILATDAGGMTAYQPAADTDAARGAALIAAIAAMAPGEAIRLGPGTYDTGTTQMELPAGASLTGSGWSTIIDCDKRTHNFKLNSNVTIADLKAVCVTPSNSSGHSIFGNASAGFTGVRFENCWLVGEQDVWNGYGVAGAQAMTVSNCLIETKFDVKNSSGCVAGTTSVWEYCHIIADGAGNPDSSAGLAGMTCTANETVSVSGTWIEMGDAAASPGTGGTGVAVTLGTINLRDVTVTRVAGSGPGTDLLRTSGTLNVSGGSGSGTSGAYTTSGTITYVPLLAARMPALTGDITTTAGAVATTLATVNGNVGSFGSSTSIPTLTVNAKGLVTAASGNAVIAPAGTLTGAALASGVTASSLSSLGTQGAHLLFTDNTYDIGASGATRPRTGYFGTSVFTPRLDVATSINVRSGTGSPEGAITANIGSLYLRSEGTANSAVYIKTSGTGNTGWSAITTLLPTMSTDPIWQNKGELAVARASFEAVALAAGTNGQVLSVDSAENTGLKWITSPWLPLAGGTMTGNLLFTDNTYDIGASGATRPRTGYFGTSVFAPRFDVATSVGWRAGTGSPEGVITANIGSLYSRTDGGTNTSFYRKESGTGNTGWIAVSNAGGGGGSPGGSSGQVQFNNVGAFGGSPEFSWNDAGKVLDIAGQINAEGITVTGDVTLESIFATGGTLDTVSITNGSFEGTIESGTAFDDAADTRTALGVAIGTNVQAFDADLSDLADGSLTESKIDAAVTRDAEWDTIGEVETIWSGNILLESEIDASSELRALMDDEVGAGPLMFTRTGVYRTVWVGAGAMIPRTTNGAATGTEELATNDIMLDYFAFDDTTAEAVQFAWAIPDQWDVGTVKVKLHWYSASSTTSHTTVWGVKARAVSNDDALDGTWGTEVEVSDDVIAAGDLHITAATGAVTVGGTPALADLIMFEIDQDATEADHVGDAKLIGVQIQYLESATESSAW